MTAKIIEVSKNHYVINVSAEYLYLAKAAKDARYLREARQHVTSPTAESWALYYQALAGLRALEAYSGTEWGGPDYGTEVNPPEPTVTLEYLETEEQWHARCQELDKTEPPPTYTVDWSRIGDRP